MTKLSNILLAAILIVLLFNVYQTHYIARELAEGQSTERSGTTVDAAVGKEWGRKVAALYNAQDHEQLHALFHPQAKIKISLQKLEGQLKKLYALFGPIEETAFRNSVRLGEKADEVYYQLFYRARVSNTEHQQASMTLSVIQDGDDLQLYGFKLNARQSLE